MSHLQGYVTANYAELERKLGVPEFGPDGASGDGKVTCEWIAQGEVFGRIVTASVYDYKEGSTPREEYDWHVGGDSHAALWLVEKLLGNSALVEPLK